MRAVCLLLCFVLARDAAGSILRHQYYPVDRLTVQPTDFIDQNQQHRHQRHQHHRRPDSSQSSQESKERVPNDDRNTDYLQSPDSLMNAWNSALFSSVNSHAEHRPASNDLIEWHEEQMASAPSFPDTMQKDDEKSSIFYDAFITTSHMSDDDQKRFHEAFRTSVQASNEDVQLAAPQLLKKHQYKVEEHTVKTDDGYILTLFRIPPKKQEKQEKEQQSHEQQQEQSHEQRQEQHQQSLEQRQEQHQQSHEQQQEQSQEQQSSEVQNAPVVFLMHGLLGSADDWLLMGPGKSLAFLLADAGFDVWLGNARGNKYSRRHASKHRAQPDFWQFSTDEIALHDLPAMIDYTLNKTKQEKLVYVGHSQGTTAFFALASTRPEYNEKIVMMHAIHPMVYMTNVRSPLLHIIGEMDQISDERLKKTLFGNGEFKPNKDLIQSVCNNVSKNQRAFKVCSNVAFLMNGINTENVDVKLVPVIMGHMPAGASVRQVSQYGQALASHEFRRYDFGSDINQKMYGEKQPPKYDMTKVQVPVALYYSEDDWLAHPKDVDRLRQELPDVRDNYKVFEQFTAMDFLFSDIAPEVVYKKLIESIKKIEK